MTASIVGRLELWPSRSRLCVVTGSKGKGTVARLLAWNLKELGHNVGFVLSPEELSHLDRIRIDNVPIDPETFCGMLGELKPILDEQLTRQGSDFYFPPTAIFLLVALLWFQRKGVMYVVIEGGRGAAFDEIGQLPARLGIVTNVLLEHARRLGPTLDHIAADKFALTKNCELVVTGKPTAEFIKRSPMCGQVHHARVIGVEYSACKSHYPFWYSQLRAVARKGCEILSGCNDWTDFQTPAFFFIQEHRPRQGEDIVAVCDACINPAGIDIEFLRARSISTGTALVGLPSDKDVTGIIHRLRLAGFARIFAVRLVSPIGHIESHWLNGFPEVQVVNELDVVEGGTARLREIVLALFQKWGVVYALGNQLFIRSMRQAFGLTIAAPRRLM